MQSNPSEETPPQNPPDPAPRSVAGEAIAAWKEGGRAFVVVRIPGDGPNGEDVEYLGAVSEGELARLGPAEQRQALLAAVRAERDWQRAIGAVQVRELVGPVEL